MKENPSSPTSVVHQRPPPRAAHCSIESFKMAAESEAIEAALKSIVVPPGTPLNTPFFSPEGYKFILGPDNKLEYCDPEGDRPSSAMEDATHAAEADVASAGSSFCSP